MEISALRTTLLVQDHGSFAGAARVLGVDPSSVSRIVAGVEAELGLRLFHRTTRHLSVTEEGRAYLQRIAPVLDEMQAAQDSARHQQTHPSGTLRMTASVALSCEQLVPRLPAFQHRYPGITVDLTSSDTNLDLAENGIDLAIRLAPAPKGDLISTRLMDTVYRVVASPDFVATAPPLTDPTDLMQVNCLRFSLPGLPDHWQFQTGSGAPVAVPVAGTALMSNALALRAAARAGMGAALLADWMIRDDLRHGHLIDLFPEHKCALTTFDTAAWALYPSRQHLPRKVRVMLDFLRETLPTP